MRHKVLWNLLVTLFVCGLLLPGLSARAGDAAPGAGKTPVVKQPIAPAAPESEGGVVMPGEAEGFNPQPEPPAAEGGPVPPGGKKVAHPPEKKGIDPGDDGRLVHPPEKKATEPIDQ